MTTNIAARRLRRTVSDFAPYIVLANHLMLSKFVPPTYAMLCLRGSQERHHRTQDTKTTTDIYIIVHRLKDTNSMYAGLRVYVHALFVLD